MPINLTQPSLFAPTASELPSIDSLINRDALFVVNHSGGKDSQAMYHYIMERVPAAQVIVAHADLPEVDWAGTLEHVEETIGDTPLLISLSVKTFFDMVEHRGMFPSPSNRQCTSDLKRGPIERDIRRYLKSHPHFNGLVVSCMGMRAEESAARTKLPTFGYDKRNSKAGREWYSWLPIHAWTETQVFARIAQVGQKPHWAYEAGMTRLSCCFCIMASAADLTTAARLNPALYARYVETEKRLGHTLLMPAKGKARGLEVVTGVAATGIPAMIEELTRDLPERRME